jgi:penicillin amidase
VLDAGSAWYGAEGRDAAFRRVAARALEGPSPPWGRVQRIELKHLLLGGRLPRWLGFDRGPLPLPGGRATPHQGQVYRSGGRTTSFAPSFRLVTDFAEPAAHTALAGGPSDRRFSRWYASGIEAWRRGRLKRLEPAAPASSSRRRAP